MTEGWIPGSLIPNVSGGSFGVSTVLGNMSNASLFIGHTDDGFSNATVQLCPAGTQLDLSTKRFLVDIYAAPTAGPDLLNNFNMELFVWYHNGKGPDHSNDLFSGGSYLDLIDGTINLKARTWTTVRSTGTLIAGISALEVQFRTYNGPWIGTVYFDNMRLE
jgi:hypothetical protein